MSSIGIISYGAGNVASVQNALNAVGIDSHLVSDKAGVMSSDRLIMPGVGAAGRALYNLRRNSLHEYVLDFIINRQRPFLGICLGMQLLSETVHEFGEHKALGILPGKVIPLQEVFGTRERVPHTGWNTVEVSSETSYFFEKIAKFRTFYFNHSNTLMLDNDEIISAKTFYGVSIIAAIQKNNIFATQFHPEKSDISGLKILEKFTKWSP